MLRMEGVYERVEISIGQHDTHKIQVLRFGFGFGLAFSESNGVTLDLREAGRGMPPFKPTNFVCRTFKSKPNDVLSSMQGSSQEWG